MNISHLRTAGHRESWDLLPWLVNGRLSEPDRQRVEAHVRSCDDCQRELAAQRLLHQSIAADSTVEQLPMAGLHKLRQRIDDLDSVAARPPTSRRKIYAAWGFGRRAWAASVVVALLVGGVGIFMRQHVRAPGGADSYYTVTTAAPAHADAVVRAVFAPALTLSELQAMLDDAQLRIVSGPSEAGVYSLAMTGSEPIEWSLQRLRAHAGVRFAESTLPTRQP